MPHLLHKDEPHVRRFSQLHCRLHLFGYIDARQKFRIRASSGNLVIYNSSRSCLWGEKFCFASPYLYMRVPLFMVRFTWFMGKTRPNPQEALCSGLVSTIFVVSTA